MRRSVGSERDHFAVEDGLTHRKPANGLDDFRNRGRHVAKVA